MMLRTSLIVSFLAATTFVGCVPLETEQPAAAALADLDAKLRLYYNASPRSFELAIDVTDTTGQLGPCPGLPAGAYAMLGNQSGALDRGGVLVDEFGHSADESCDGPSARWTQVPTGDGPLTFVVADPSTTWKLVVENPAAAQRFELVEPPTTLMSGDTITLRHAPSHGSLSNLKVSVLADDRAVVSTTNVDSADVVEHEFHFTVPPIEAEILDGLLTVVAWVSNPDLVRECTAKDGCSASISVEASTYFPMSFAP